MLQLRDLLQLLTGRGEQARRQAHAHPNVFAPCSSALSTASGASAGSSWPDGKLVKEIFLLGLSSFGDQGAAGKVLLLTFQPGHLRPPEQLQLTQLPQHTFMDVHAVSEARRWPGLGTLQPTCGPYLLAADQRICTTPIVMGKGMNGIAVPAYVGSLPEAKKLPVTKPVRAVEHKRNIKSVTAFQALRHGLG
eukprot:1142465-Pelagomonas_calceolata.AAC.5